MEIPTNIPVTEVDTIMLLLSSLLEWERPKYLL